MFSLCCIFLCQFLLHAHTHTHTGAVKHDLYNLATECISELSPIFISRGKQGGTLLS